MIEQRLQEMVGLYGRLVEAMTSMAKDLEAQAEKIEAQDNRIKLLEYERSVQRNEGRV